jgi:ECF transporter S component (folate family)
MISPTFSSGFFIAGGAVGVGNTCMDRSLPQKEDIFMKTSKKTMMTTRTLAYCALLAALSVILARLVIPMPNEFTRFSIEAVPIFLAGMLFGPLAGGMVGFTADFVGCLMFSLYGYNPIYCIPPILYGVCAGLFRHFLAKEGSLLRLAIAFLPPIVLGSIGIQSCVLSYMNYGIEAFVQGLIYFLSTRSIQFAVTMVLDVLVIYLLMRSNMFTRLGLWPPVRKENV